MDLWNYMIWPFLILLIVGGHLLDRKSKTKQNDIQKAYEEWQKKSYAQEQVMLRNQEKMIALLEQIRDGKTS